MSLATSSLGAVSRKSSLALSPAIVETLLIAVLAAMVSLLRTGFVFGIENNLLCRRSLRDLVRAAGRGVPDQTALRLGG